jgi:hypothetical protein
LSTGSFIKAEQLSAQGPQSKGYEPPQCWAGWYPAPQEHAHKESLSELCLPGPGALNAGLAAATGGLCRLL